MAAAFLFGRRRRPEGPGAGLARKRRSCYIYRRPAGVVPGALGLQAIIPLVGRQRLQWPGLRVRRAPSGGEAMRYRVTTRRSPLNVRRGPGMRYRVVSALQRGAIVNVLETREVNRGGAWCRVPSGWASRRYLTPVSAGQGTLPVPGTLSWRAPNPLGWGAVDRAEERSRVENNRSRISTLEDRIQFLTERLERVQALAYTNGQSAAMEGSRLYEMDAETRRINQIVGALESPFIAGPPSPGTTGQATVNRLNRMREFERNAVRYESEARSLERQIRTIERELEALR